MLNTVPRSEQSTWTEPGAFISRRKPTTDGSPLLMPPLSFVHQELTALRRPPLGVRADEPNLTPTQVNPSGAQRLAKKRGAPTGRMDAGEIQECDVETIPF